MRHILAISMAILLGLAMAAPALAADPARPFGGVTFGVDSMAPPDDCPDGSMWRYTSEGSGTLRHLGRVTVVVTHCSRFTSPTTGSFEHGTMTFTAANGDVLVLGQWGTFRLIDGPAGPMTSVDIDLEWEVLRGTGRFSGATGHGWADPVGDLATGRTSATYWGTIAY